MSAGAHACAAAAPPAGRDQDRFFFPVPVEGKLAREMTRLVKHYNESQKEVEVTAVYTGGYDDTKLKTQAADPRPASRRRAVLMSANFIRRTETLTATSSRSSRCSRPTRRRATIHEGVLAGADANAMDAGRDLRRAVPNSTPLLYYNVEHFKEAGLDPTKPPRTWQDWRTRAEAAPRATDYGWGLMLPGTTIISAGSWRRSPCPTAAEYFNAEYGGEVYYDQPSMLGAARFVEDLIIKHKVMPEGVTEADGVSTAFFRAARR